MAVSSHAENQLAEVYTAVEPEQVRQRVLIGGADAFCDGLIEALKRRNPLNGRVSERWAYLLFAKMAKLVGVQVDIAMLVTSQLGVPLLAARQAVEQSQALEGLDEHGLAELAARSLGWYLGRNPGERAVLMALVGQEGPKDRLSGANGDEPDSGA